MKIDEFYMTSDTMMAAYLHYKGMEFIEATTPDPENPKRKLFVMHDDTRRRQYTEEYSRHDAQVDARTYADSIQRVRSFLRNTWYPPNDK